MENTLAGFSLDGNKLGKDQLNAILEGLNTRIQLLQGPPGTGKTVTTALATLARAQLRGAGGITIVATNTHYAIDRFMEELEGRKKAFDTESTKAGFSSSDTTVYHVGKDLDRRIAASVMCSSFNKHLVVGGTINDILKFAQYSERNYRDGKISRPFEADTLIIDEASMMAFPYLIALSTMLRQDGRIMLSGDHRQLSPILKHDWESEDRPPVIKYHPHYSAYDSVAAIADSMSERKGKVIRSALDTTYRLPWEIREIISGVYREDGIELAGVKRHEERSLQVNDDIWSTVWLEEGVFLMVHDEDRSKNFNEYEAELIEKVLSVGTLEERSVAVMTPHRAQRTLLKDRLSRFKGKVDIIDTVEKLQGGERPTIIVSGTQSDPSSIANAADFILNLNRSNVIFSRAKNRLVVVCSRSLLSSVPADTKQYQTARLWKRLRDFCGREVQSANLSGHTVQLFIHDDGEIETGGVVGLVEIGEAPAEVPAFTSATVPGDPSSVAVANIRGRGKLPGILDRFLGSPPIKEIVVDGSNVAWSGHYNDKPDKEQLKISYRDLKEVYGFDRVYLLVGPGSRHDIGLDEFKEIEEWFDRESKKTGMQILHEAPGGAYDDRFTISFAIIDDLLILTNDKFRDIVEHDPVLCHETISRSVRYVFANGHLRIGQWPSYWE
ncbi:MAG: AAA domain-containing protein [Methanomassiliicoccales archaeon]